MENVSKFGFLYNWNTAYKNCPEGWRLPTREDWETARDYLGGVEKLIKVLKIGFCGCRSLYDKFNFLNERAYFWTAERCDARRAHHCMILNEDESLTFQEYYQSYAYSIRYIKSS